MLRASFFWARFFMVSSFSDGDFRCADASDWSSGALSCSPLDKGGPSRRRWRGWGGVGLWGCLTK